MSAHQKEGVSDGSPTNRVVHNAKKGRRSQRFLARDTALRRKPGLENGWVRRAATRRDRTAPYTAVNSAESARGLASPSALTLRTSSW